LINSLKLQGKKFYKQYSCTYIVGQCREESLPVYGLDCTDVSLWDDNVSKPATTILTALKKVKLELILVIL
jgi:hypothetical protein